MKMKGSREKKKKKRHVFKEITLCSCSNSNGNSRRPTIIIYHRFITIFRKNHKMVPKCHITFSHSFRFKVKKKKNRKVPYVKYRHIFIKKDYILSNLLYTYRYLRKKYSVGTFICCNFKLKLKNKSEFAKKKIKNYDKMNHFPTY